MKFSKKVEPLGFLAIWKAEFYFMEEGPSLTSIYSKTESSFESMKSLHYDSIIFASEDHDIIGAISKPATYFYASRFYELASFQSYIASCFLSSCCQFGFYPDPFCISL